MHRKMNTNIKKKKYIGSERANTVCRGAVARIQRQWNVTDRKIHRNAEATQLEKRFDMEKENQRQALATERERKERETACETKKHTE